MVKEHWFPCTVDGEPYPYEVSDKGRVRRVTPNPHGDGTWPGKILRPAKQSSGYLTVTLSKHGRGHTRTVLVHRLVLEAFRGPFPPGMESNHLDSRKTHNILRNLEFRTHKNNSWRAVLDIERRSATHLGELNGNAKLSKWNVLDILGRYIEGEKVSVLAEEYGVDRHTISNICAGHNWQHITMPGWKA